MGRTGEESGGLLFTEIRYINKYMDSDLPARRARPDSTRHDNFGGGDALSNVEYIQADSNRDGSHQTCQLTHQKTRLNDVPRSTYVITALGDE